MAQKDNILLSFGIQGMERSGFDHQLDEKMFTFQRNGNLESDEESLGLTNEHSNLLCSKFKPGYVVIGKKYDGNNNRILFILTERYPDENGKRKSEIGQIKFNTTNEKQPEFPAVFFMLLYTLVLLELQNKKYKFFHHI